MLVRTIGRFLRLVSTTTTIATMLKPGNAMVIAIGYNPPPSIYRNGAGAGLRSNRDLFKCVRGKGQRGGTGYDGCIRKATVDPVSIHPLYGRGPS